MLVEEAAHEDFKPFFEGFVVVGAAERLLCQAIELCGRGAVSEHMIKVKIVQFIRTDKILGLLRDLTVFVGGEKLGGDGGVQNIPQHGGEGDLSVRFGIVGVICFVIDYGLMALLTEVFSVNYLLSCGISFTLSTVVNYLLSMRYVFRRGNAYGRKTEFVIFVVMSLVGLGLTELLMLLFSDVLHVHYLISKIVVTVIVMAYNFVTRKLVLERNKKQQN